MTEDYLHYIWKFSKFDQIQLFTTEKEKIQIIKKGFHNINAGADFLEGQVLIGETRWAGSIEIHIKTSDWYLHKHEDDERYNNVILHVVYEHDKDILNQKGEEIPVLELKGLLDETAYFYYEQFLSKGNKLPCEDSFLDVPSLVINSTIDNMLVERLERKSNEIIKSLAENNGDWEESFHQFLFKYMGMKVNSEQMLELSKRLPMKLLKKESQSILSLEALIFGQAGLLDNELDLSYHKELRREFLYLKQKYSLNSMKGIVWKFSRMRPPNFPTLRMAQLAAIYTATKQLFYIIRDCMSIEDIAIVLDVEPSGFWQMHYSFTADKSKTNSGKIGMSTLNAIIINCIVPFAFAYGRSVGNLSYEKYALELLEKIKPEVNSITKKMSAVGFENDNSKASQSLIQLHNEYCVPKKCLNCKIGVYLLQ